MYRPDTLHREEEDKKLWDWIAKFRDWEFTIMISWDPGDKDCREYIVYVKNKFLKSMESIMIGDWYKSLLRAKTAVWRFLLQECWFRL